MKRIVTLLIAGLAAGCMASDEPVELTERAQSRLDEALAGRSAGAAVTCVPSRELRNTRTVGDGVMLFEAPGDVLWVNRPPGGLKSQIDLLDEIYAAPDAHGRNDLGARPKAHLNRLSK